MNSTANPADLYQSTVQSIVSLLGQNRVDEAVNACLALMKTHPESNDALLLLGKARQMQGRFDDMLTLVETALAREPQNVGLQLQYAGACQFCGHHDRAAQQLAATEQVALDDAELLQNVAQLYVSGGRYDDAHRCYLRAVELHGNEPRYLANLASSYIAVGNLEKAEDTYTALIKRLPGNYEAWYNRSTLRTQTADSNHIRKLEKKLKKLAPDDARTTPICYALAKEHEDLGKDAQSFVYLKRGADSYRRRSGYDVQLDVALMQNIAQLFDSGYAQNAHPATERSSPIFVIGLPRSGTTLVDRIISSHSQVQSMGEINDFALTLNRVGQTSDRQQLLQRCAAIDPDRLGTEYLRSVASYGSDAPFFIDKTPTNFLYVGLIAKALPGATIIHVKRHPVDSCLSMYRALFRVGYPFSYDLGDLAEYYIAYDALMRHWRSVFPGRILDVSYEDLVDNQEPVSRDLIAHCGLEWEPACLEFDRNQAPVATASAAQVRKPVYRDALARWRRFEKPLSPLIERLLKAGISI
jgi:tetratricopeptide (TPR) repeat protein